MDDITYKNYTAKYMGFSQLRSKNTKHPIRRIDISYFPYSEIQIENAKQLMELSKEFFPDFVLFNNLFAGTTIEDLVIYGKNFYKSELFQVLFADNLVVI